MPAKKRARAGSGASSSASASAGAGAGGGAGAQTPKKPFDLNRFVQDRTELTGLTLFVPRVIKSWTWEHMCLSRSADTPPVWREVCLVCKWTGVHHTIVPSPLCIRSSLMLKFLKPDTTTKVLSCSVSVSRSCSSLGSRACARLLTCAMCVFVV